MIATSLDSEPYCEAADGLFVAASGVRHRDDEYDSSGFELLRRMQHEHFWYLGRHRWLMHALRKYAPSLPQTGGRSQMIDLGGGCGGWLRYVQTNGGSKNIELALGDSSLHALETARETVGPAVRLYQIDLLNLGWHERWDGAFLLDVLEHIPADVDALRQIAASLRPGGMLFVTTPALERFRSYNDRLAHHVRRYAKADFVRLADATGLELCDARYFMFFLSPLLVASRLLGPDVSRMSEAERRAMMLKTHRTPAAPLNRLLTWIFSCETPLGYWLSFPWGTSLLGVFRKPTGAR